MHIVNGLDIDNFDLKHIRALLKLSQADLADLLFISVRTVQNWEYRNCCPMSVYSLLWRYYFLTKQLEQVPGQMSISDFGGVPPPTNTAV